MKQSEPMRKRERSAQQQRAEREARRASEQEVTAIRRALREYNQLVRIHEIRRWVPEDGEEFRWGLARCELTSRPIIDGDRVRSAYNAATGRVVWQHAGAAPPRSLKRALAVLRGALSYWWRIAF